MSYQTIPKLFENNLEWVTKMKENNAGYFEDMADNQEPAYLWIGCSDSRVPPNLLTGTEPGEIFIHRNIANMVVNTDYNLHSVLTYAVEHLKVKHVIVCGHYNCGGVNAAMSSKSFGFLDNWLLNIKNVMRHHSDEINAITDEKEKARRVTELNVIEQVNNLAYTAIIQKAWKDNDEFPTLHGWVYDIHKGIIKDLISLDRSSKLDGIFSFDQ